MPANTQTCQYFTGNFAFRGVYGKTPTTTCQYFTGNFADRFVVGETDLVDPPSYIGSFSEQQQSLIAIPF